MPMTSNSPRIPSPRQSYDAPTRRPSSAGGDRDARNRDAMMESYMSRPEMMEPEMVDSEWGTIRPGMSQEEIDMYNKPQMDINDAFFGPETRGMTLIDMIIKAIQDAGRIPSPETR